jgi:hypothetical protein
MANAHLWIEAQWDALKSGEVVDVQYILKERLTKKISERFDYYGEESDRQEKAAAGHDTAKQP